MENNKENKAKFFAQYYGQRVGMFRKDNHEDFDLFIGIDLIISKVVCVRLKPLSSISDEDATEVARILSGEIYVIIDRDN